MPRWLWPLPFEIAWAWLTRESNVRRQAGIAVFTAIEDAALVAWLALVRPFVNVFRSALGVLLLPVGFFLEHWVAANVKMGRSGFGLLAASFVPFRGIAVNAVVETALWVVWLALWPWYPFAVFGVGVPLPAILFLQIGLIVEHNLTDNIFRGRPLASGLFARRVWGFSTVENLGATLWLALIGAGLPALGVVALVLFQYVEHDMALRVASRRK